jgi:hypothetical protein
MPRRPRGTVGLSENENNLMLAGMLRSYKFFHVYQFGNFIPYLTYSNNNDTIAERLITLNDRGSNPIFNFTGSNFLNEFFVRVTRQNLHLASVANNVYTIKGNSPNYTSFASLPGVEEGRQRLLNSFYAHKRTELGYLFLKAFQTIEPVGLRALIASERFCLPPTFASLLANCTPASISQVRNGPYWNDAALSATEPYNFIFYINVPLEGGNLFEILKLHWGWLVPDEVITTYVQNFINANYIPSLRYHSLLQAIIDGKNLSRETLPNYRISYLDTDYYTTTTLESQGIKKTEIFGSGRTPAIKVFLEMYTLLRNAKKIGIQNIVSPTPENLLEGNLYNDTNQNNLVYDDFVAVEENAVLSSIYRTGGVPNFVNTESPTPQQVTQEPDYDILFGRVPPTPAAPTEQPQEVEANNTLALLPQDSTYARLVSIGETILTFQDTISAYFVDVQQSYYAPICFRFMRAGSMDTLKGYIENTNKFQTLQQNYLNIRQEGFEEPHNADAFGVKIDHGNEYNDANPLKGVVVGNVPRFTWITKTRILSVPTDAEYVVALNAARQETSSPNSKFYFRWIYDWLRIAFDNTESINGRLTAKKQNLQDVLNLHTFEIGFPRFMAVDVLWRSREEFTDAQYQSFTYARETEYATVKRRYADAHPYLNFATSIDGLNDSENLQIINDARAFTAGNADSENQTLYNNEQAVGVISNTTRKNYAYHLSMLAIEDDTEKVFDWYLTTANQLFTYVDSLYKYIGGWDISERTKFAWYLLGTQAVPSNTVLMNDDSLENKEAVREFYKQIIESIGRLCGIHDFYDNWTVTRNTALNTKFVDVTVDGVQDAVLSYAITCLLITEMAQTGHSQVLGFRYDDVMQYVISRFSIRPNELFDSAFNIQSFACFFEFMPAAYKMHTKIRQKTEYNIGYKDLLEYLKTLVFQRYSYKDFFGPLKNEYSSVDREKLNVDSLRQHLAYPIYSYSAKQGEELLSMILTKIFRKNAPFEGGVSANQIIDFQRKIKSYSDEEWSSILNFPVSAGSGLREYGLPPIRQVLLEFMNVLDEHAKAQAGITTAFYGSNRPAVGARMFTYIEDEYAPTRHYYYDTNPESETGERIYLVDKANRKYVGKYYTTDLLTTVPFVSAQAVAAAQNLEEIYKNVAEAPITTSIGVEYEATHPMMSGYGTGFDAAVSKWQLEGWIVSTYEAAQGPNEIKITTDPSVWNVATRTLGSFEFVSAPIVGEEALAYQALVLQTLLKLGFQTHYSAGLHIHLQTRGDRTGVNTLSIEQKKNLLYNVGAMEPFLNKCTIPYHRRRANSQWANSVFQRISPNLTNFERIATDMDMQDFFGRSQGSRYWFLNVQAEQRQPTYEFRFPSSNFDITNVQNLIRLVSKIYEFSKQARVPAIGEIDYERLFGTALYTYWLNNALTYARENEVDKTEDNLPWRYKWNELRNQYR